LLSLVENGISKNLIATAMERTVPMVEHHLAPRTLLYDEVLHRRMLEDVARTTKPDKIII
jgi:hypothetical protein